MLLGLVHPQIFCFVGIKADTYFSPLSHTTDDDDINLGAGSATQYPGEASGSAEEDNGMPLESNGEEEEGGGDEGWAWYAEEEMQGFVGEGDGADW